MKGDPYSINGLLYEEDLVAEIGSEEYKDKCLIQVKGTVRPREITILLEYLVGLYQPKELMRYLKTSSRITRVINQGD